MVSENNNFFVSKEFKCAKNYSVRNRYTIALLGLFFMAMCCFQSTQNFYLREEIKQSHDELRKEIREEIKQSHDELREEIKEEIKQSHDELRKEIREEIKQSQDELRKEIREEIKQSHDELRKEIKHSLDELRKEINALQQKLAEDVVDMILDAVNKKPTNPTRVREDENHLSNNLW